MRFALVALLAIVAMPALAQQLFEGGFTPGRYELQPADPAAPAINLCLRDSAELARPVHRGAAGCSTQVLSASNDRAVIHYSCPARGFGDTIIRRQSSTAFRIETQGIAQQAPFNTSFNAQRVGDCEEGDKLALRRR